MAKAEGNPTAVRLTVDRLEPVSTALYTSGDWLEDIVAACLIEAGAEEVIQSLQFPFPPELDHRREPVRDELDVVARIAHNYFLLDCKSGDARPRTHRTTTEALASKLGRFTVPIAVRPAGSEQTNPRGASDLTLATIVDTANLRQRLLTIARQRSTTE